MEGFIKLTAEGRTAWINIQSIILVTTSDAGKTILVFGEATYQTVEEDALEVMRRIKVVTGAEDLY